MQIVLYWTGYQTVSAGRSVASPQIHSAARYSPSQLKAANRFRGRAGEREWLSGWHASLGPWNGTRSRYERTIPDPDRMNFALVRENGQCAGVQQKMATVIGRQIDPA